MQKDGVSNHKFRIKFYNYFSLFFNLLKFRIDFKYYYCNNHSHASLQRLRNFRKFHIIHIIIFYYIFRKIFYGKCTYAGCTVGERFNNNERNCQRV